MRNVFIFIIELYQRFISPRKSFRCAYHAYWGGATCSGYSKKAFSRFGILRGICLTIRGFKACSATLQLAQDETSEDENTRNEQQKDRDKCLISYHLSELACCSFLSIFG